jgi:hypothetical protein
MKKKFDAVVSVDISAFIPEYYVDSDSERFEFLPTTLRGKRF